MRSAALLRRPTMPAPTSDFERMVLDTFIGAGRDSDRIVEARQRLVAQPLDDAQAAVVDRCYRFALGRVGVIL